MKFLILFIFVLFLSIEKSSSSSSPSLDFTLYSLTANGLGDSDPIVMVYSSTSDIVYSKSLPSINGWIVQGISSVNKTANTITVLCNDRENINSYLFEVDIENDNIALSLGPIYVGLEINNNINILSYLFFENQIFLPAVVEGFTGLVLLGWDFDEEQNGVSTLNFNISINSKVNPIGAIDKTNNMLYVAYQEKYSEYTSIATIDLSSYDGSSSDFEDTITTIKSSSDNDPIIKGLHAKDISLLYCDEQGDIYSLQSSATGVTVCKIDLIHGVCNNVYTNQLPLNPNSFTFTPYFISENKNSIITLLSKEGDYQSLLMTAKSTNSPWSASTTPITITNYWNSTGTLDYTFFMYA